MSKRRAQRRGLSTLVARVIAEALARASTETEHPGKARPEQPNRCWHWHWLQLNLQGVDEVGGTAARESVEGIEIIKKTTDRGDIVTWCNGKAQSTVEARAKIVIGHQ